jgi:hypothetical protein
MAFGIPTLSPLVFPCARGRAAHAMNEHDVGHPIWVGCILNDVQIFEVCQRSLPNAKRFGMAELLATRRDLRRDRRTPPGPHLLEKDVQATSVCLPAQSPY